MTEVPARNPNGIAGAIRTKNPKEYLTKIPGGTPEGTFRKILEGVPEAIPKWIFWRIPGRIPGDTPGWISEKNLKEMPYRIPRGTPESVLGGILKTKKKSWRKSHQEKNLKKKNIGLRIRSEICLVILSKLYPKPLFAFSGIHRNSFYKFFHSFSQNSSRYLSWRASLNLSTVFFLEFSRVFFFDLLPEFLRRFFRRSFRDFLELFLGFFFIKISRFQSFSQDFWSSFSWGSARIASGISSRDFSDILPEFIAGFVLFQDGFPIVSPGIFTRSLQKLPGISLKGFQSSS